MDQNSLHVNAAEPRQRGQQVCQLSKGSKTDNRNKPYTNTKPRKSNQQGKSFLTGLKHHPTTSTAVSQPDSKSVNDKPMIIKIENLEDEEGKEIDERYNNSTSTTSCNSVIGVSNSVPSSCHILNPKSSKKLPGLTDAVSASVDDPVSYAPIELEYGENVHVGAFRSRHSEVSTPVSFTLDSVNFVITSVNGGGENSEYSEKGLESFNVEVEPLDASESDIAEDDNWEQDDQSLVDYGFSSGSVDHGDKIGRGRPGRGKYSFMLQAIS